MGAIFTTDESQPKPTGHYLARLNLHVTGTAYDIWMLWEALMVACLFTSLWTPNTPEALFYMYIPTLFGAVFIFIFDSLYMGSLKRTKKEALTTERIWDRIIRSATNQWLSTAMMVGSGFTLIFMLCFYNDRGVAPWLPIVASPTGFQIESLFIRKGFELATLALNFTAFIISLYTGGDSLKRHINAMIRTSANGGDDTMITNNSFEMSVSQYTSHLLQ